MKPEVWDEDTIQWFIAISKAKKGDPSLLTSLFLKNRPISVHAQSLLERCAQGDPTLLPNLGGRDLPLMLAASEHVLAGPHRGDDAKTADLAARARKYGVTPTRKVKNLGDTTEPEVLSNDDARDVRNAKDYVDGKSVRNVLNGGGDWDRLHKIRKLVTQYMKDTRD